MSSEESTSVYTISLINYNDNAIMKIQRNARVPICRSVTAAARKSVLQRIQYPLRQR